MRRKIAGPFNQRIERDGTAPRYAEIDGLGDFNDTIRGSLWAMISKRLFDLLVCIIVAPLWLPALALAGAAIFVGSGLPIFYVSSRRVFSNHTVRIWKFRTMVRDADKIANRNMIPVAGQRFLNIDIKSPLYTDVGRFVERCNLTELPQILHVLSGTMHVIGNRPLPEDVIETLKADFPNAEERFSVRCGLMGPVQLIGRENISDADRLMLEITYARCCREHYSIWLDIILAAKIAMVLLGGRRQYSAHALCLSMSKWAGMASVAET